MVRQDIIRLSKQTLVYGFGYVTARMINFLLLPFYSHHIQPREYGIISLVYAFIAFLNIIYHYGLESAFLRFFSRAEIPRPDMGPAAAGEVRAGRGADREGGITKKDVFSTVFISLIGTSLLFSFLIWSFAPGLSEALLKTAAYARIVRMTAVILLLDALFLIPLHYLRIRNKAGIFTSVTLVNVIINVGLNIYLIRFRGMGIDGVFISNIAASGFNFLVLIPVVVRNWNGRFSGSLWKKLLLFGLPFIPSGLSSMIIELSDRYMLEWFEGLRTVGLYSAGHKLGIFMMLVVMAFRFAWQPFFLQKQDDPDARPLFAVILTYFVFAMSLVFLLISFFIKEIVSLPVMGVTLIGADYWSGIVVVPYILAAYVFNGIYINFHPAIFYSGRTWVISVVVGIAAVINVTANLILIPRVGMTGAGISSLAAYVFMAVCTYVIVRKWMPVPYEWKKLLLMFVLTLAAFAVFLAFDIRLPAGKALIVLGYAVAVLPFIYPRGRMPKNAA